MGGMGKTRKKLAKEQNAISKGTYRWQKIGTWITIIALAVAVIGLVWWAVHTYYVEPKREQAREAAEERRKNELVAAIDRISELPTQIDPTLDRQIAPSYDSLKEVLERNTDDIGVIGATNLLRLGVAEFMMGRFDSSSKYLRYSLSEGERTSDTSVIVSSYLNLGLIHISKYELGEARSSLEKALDINYLTNDLVQRCLILGYLGILNSTADELDAALSYLHRAVEIAESQNYKRYIALNLGNIAVVYRKQGKYQEARFNARRSLSLARETSDSLIQATSIHELGVIMNIFDRNPDSALACFKESYKLYERIEYRQGKAIALGDMGIAYASLNKLDSAVSCFRRSLRIHQSTGNRFEEYNQLVNLRRGFQEIGNRDSSTVYSHRVDSLRQIIGDV
jgi:tetratricopeptide (TPR) repeat protein